MTTILINDIGHRFGIGISKYGKGVYSVRLLVTVDRAFSSRMYVNDII